MKKTLEILAWQLIILLPCALQAQITSLTDAQGLTEGTHTFNLGSGDFQAYVDSEGWILWMQYHHQGGTNPNTRIITEGNSLPIYDASPLGTDLSTDLSKWGHGSQAFAASIPDQELWLRWEAETSNHDRKIHFESPVLGKFLSDTGDDLTPDIASNHILRPDHTANLPAIANGRSRNNKTNSVLTNGPFWKFGSYTWEIKTGDRWTVDDVRNDDADETLINFEHSTIHRVWVKPVPFDENILITALDELSDHVNGQVVKTDEELVEIKKTINLYADKLPSSELLITKAFDLVEDYDIEIGPLFTTPTTQNGFRKDPLQSPDLEVERAMIALQQGLFDFVFTAEIYAEYPQLIGGFKYKSCVSFPGDVDPPIDPNTSKTIPIRANFEDPWGINPAYSIDGYNTEHAFRPTGMYLTPGSVVTVTVPSSLVGKDYYVQVGAHSWDLINRPIFKRLDRISKRFLIDATTIEIFNPFGGAIGVNVPYGATEGIQDITIRNGVEAPFCSLKSFYETPDFDAELSKPAPWTVFESDKVMYTVPTHTIVPGRYDLKQALMQWDTAVDAINSILSRQLRSDKHHIYMIPDVIIRASVLSIGYPMSNWGINYSNVPGGAYFIDGPGQRYNGSLFHEHGHAVNISKFPGEQEALVNFLYTMSFNYGFGQDLNEAVKESFGLEFDIDNTAIFRLVSNSFGSERDKANSTTNEVRYQHRGFGHYFEIVDLFGWCALKNFWHQEAIDVENGMGHGINGQNPDSRTLRMSIAAGVDLRPLFHVFGILPDDNDALQIELDNNNIKPSLAIYNRLQEYEALIPTNNTEFLDYALEVFPKLNNDGPNGNVDFGIGWHYQKSLTYNETEAQSRTAILNTIIDLYFPDGQPNADTNPILFCLQEEICDGLDNNGDGQTDEHLINTWIGPNEGFWNESDTYWSLGQLPNSCQEVVIDESNIVTLRNGNVGFSYIMSIGKDADLIVEPRAQMISRE